MTTGQKTTIAEVISAIKGSHVGVDELNTPLIISAPKGWLIQSLSVLAESTGIIGHWDVVAGCHEFNLGHVQEGIAKHLDHVGIFSSCELVAVIVALHQPEGICIIGNGETAMSALANIDRHLTGHTHEVEQVDPTQNKPFNARERVKRTLSVKRVTHDGSWDHTGTRQNDRVWFASESDDVFVWDTANKSGKFSVGVHGSFSMNEIGADSEKVFVSNVRAVST